MESDPRDGTSAPPNAARGRLAGRLARSRRPRGGTVPDAGASTSAASVAGARESLRASLARRCPEAALLHDRRVAGIAAPVGMIAVAESGVHVIATLPSSDLELVVRAVRDAVVPSDPDALVRGCVCARPPAREEAASAVAAASGGFPILDPRSLASRLTSPGPLSAGRVERIARLLDERFPPA